MELKEILLHYAPLPAECIWELERASELVRVEAGKTILAQGEKCNHWYFNRNGLTRVSYSEGNHETTFLFGSEGDIYTSLHTWFSGEVSPFTLSSIDETELYMVNYSTMRRQLAIQPEMARWLMTLYEGQLYSLERRFLKYNNRNATERFLELFGKDWPNLERVGGKTLAQRIPLKYIASYLGIKPETLSRLRKRLFCDGK